MFRRKLVKKAKRNNFKPIRKSNQCNKSIKFGSARFLLLFLNIVKYSIFAYSYQNDMMVHAAIATHLDPLKSVYLISCPVRRVSTFTTQKVVTPKTLGTPPKEEKMPPHTLYFRHKVHLPSLNLCQKNFFLMQNHKQNDTTLSFINLVILKSPNPQIPKPLQILQTFLFQNHPT